MKLMKLLCVSSLFLVTGVFASLPPVNIMTVQFTANSLVTDLPADAQEQRITVSHPWENRIPPSFPITATPTTSEFFVSQYDTMVALQVVKRGGLTYFYYCNDLRLNYAAKNGNHATITFSGAINNKRPGTGVTCQCSGLMCSTTSPVSTQLVIK